MKEQKLIKVEQLLGNKYLNYYKATYQTNGKQRDYFFTSRNSLEDLAITNDKIKPTAVEMFTYYKKGGKLFIAMIKEFRSPLGRYIYSFPAGLIEKDESPLVAAVREVQEELGGKPKQVHFIQNYPLAMCAGLTDEANCLAVVELDTISEQHLEESEDIKVEIFESHDLETKIANNELPLTASGYLGILSILYYNKEGK